MPTGIYYPLEFRRLVYQSYVLRQRTAEWILNNQLSNPNISLQYLWKAVWAQNI